MNKVQRKRVSVGVVVVFIVSLTMIFGNFSFAGDKMNINTASESELTQLNGIGDVIAKRIVEYREANGPFKSIEDIKKVKGIGDKIFEKIKDSITVGEAKEEKTEEGNKSEKKKQ